MNFIRDIFDNLCKHSLHAILFLPLICMCITISLMITSERKGFCWNRMKFLACHTLCTLITNRQLVISAWPPRLLATWLIHFTSFSQSCICLLYPIHCSNLLHILLVTSHSKNKCENVSRCCPQKAQSRGTLIPNFCNLSNVAKRFCIASHKINLYLGCIFGCRTRCFQVTLG